MTFPNSAAAATWPQMPRFLGSATLRNATMRERTPAPRKSRVRTIWLGVSPSSDTLMNVKLLPHSSASSRNRPTVAFSILPPW